MLNRRGLVVLRGLAAKAAGAHEWPHNPVLRWVSASAIVLLLVTITRWPLAPEYLYYFDSANFALALERFDPSLHQPQPPGYPLFVGLTRLVHRFVTRPEDVFVITGILAACAALLVIWTLGKHMFGRAAALIAVALLITNPPFWLAGISNQIRLFLALGGSAVALLAWRAAQPGSSPGWLYGAFGALGLAAGFRPAASLLLLPLLLWVWARAGRSLRRLLFAASILGGVTVSWLAVTIRAAGGTEKWLRLLWNYSTEQFQSSSLLFGARAPSAWNMVESAVVWNGLGALAWVWAVRFNRAPWRAAGWRLKAAFLSAWFAPGFLFSAVVHIGDPDQALATIPVLCLTGGAVLAGWLDRRGSQRVFSTAVAVAAMNAFLFFVPPGRLARASSYRAVAAVDRMTRSAISTINDLRREGPVTIIHYGALVSWRQLSYYFPDDWLVVLPGTPGESAAAGESWTMSRHESRRTHRSDGIVAVPGNRRIVWLLPPGWKPQDLPSAGPGWKEYGPVAYLEPAADAVLPLGPYEFRTEVPHLGGPQEPSP